MTTNASMFARFRTGARRLFVETGTYKGDGIQSALDAGFSEIISFEYNSRAAHAARLRFNAHHYHDASFRGPAVRIVTGDSGTRLREYLNAHRDRPAALFWLDAHAHGGPDSPLLAELEALSHYAYDADVILIDDIRPDGSYHFPGLSLTATELMAHIARLFPARPVSHLDGDHHGRTFRDCYGSFSETASILCIGPTS